MDNRLVLWNLKIVELQFLVTVDNDVSCHVTWGVSRDDSRAKMFFDQSMFDIQWENNGFLIYQIVQNNDLPIVIA